MLTIEQCRAARGLVGWTQQELADACGLSKTAINNFEKGHSDIKADSLKAIRSAFEKADIEFLDNQGLRRRTDDVEVLKGPHAFDDLIDDIVRTLAAAGPSEAPEILIINCPHWPSLSPDKPENKENYNKLLSAGTHERILSLEPVKSCAQPCRTIPPAGTAGKETILSSVIYGQSVAVEFWNNAFILIMRSKEGNAEERKRFELIWESAKPSGHGDKTSQKEA